MAQIWGLFSHWRLAVDKVSSIGNTLSQGNRDNAVEIIAFI